ncbi:MFS transporter [Paenibacillus albiflavus]|uniref:MFS transporter n=1 Tax=Paenibacillus albiflavus TaxID=2545760 RepID=A0A4R4EGV6_9BACL|nr:MFS transporter [Paenibacillus albiflavus]TCZ78847.1 MFS transporter [Paenibacillus albiflavus]
MSTQTAPSLSVFFRNRFVQAILVSTFFLQIGIWVRNYSILLYVMEMTGGNAKAVSLISVAEYAPIFIFSFIGGAFADRWMPKRTMIWCDILSAVSIFGVLIAMSIGSWQVVFFTTLVSSILSQFSQPSGMKLFKLHVPEALVQMGMSLYQTMFAIFLILGPVLGAFVFQRFGIMVAIGVMGVAFLLSAATLTFIPKDRREDTVKKETHIWSEMKDGFKYVWNSKILTKLGGAFVAAGLALGIINPLGIFIVTERLGHPKEDLQWFMMTGGIAMIIGGILAMSFSKKVAPQKLLAFGMFVDAFMFVVMGYSEIFWLSLIAQFISSLVLPCIQIGINTMILQNTAESHLGRVNGILNPLFMGSMVIMMTMSGWLKDLFTLVPLYFASSVLFLIGVIVIAPLFKLKPAAQINQPAEQQA